MSLRRKEIYNSIRFFILLILAIFFLLPVHSMLIISLKSSTESINGFESMFVTRFSLSNYREVARIIPYLSYMRNTLQIAGLSMLGQMLVSPMVAYSIAKIRWCGAKIITTLLFATMMLPYFTIMVPLYKIWSSLGLTGTAWPLILCNLFGNSFNIIIIRQFILGIPDSTLEAAIIDGCNELQKYTLIILPLSKPAIATIAILSFVANWSDYLNPMLYLVNQREYTLSLGLYAFIGQHSVDWPLLMAAASAFVLPAVAVFIIFQRYFVRGIAITGIK